MLIDEMTLEEKISQLTYDAAPIERLGVPEYNWWSEALHGVARNGRATVFPSPLAWGLLSTGI
jgi:beta-glucosidase